MPTFSIVIPTFNRSALLEKCLESLTHQTFKEFEVLVCDDGSTDNTSIIVNQYKSKLNLLYYWNKNWGGPARPRNVGISAAHCDWVCFLDSDDWWHPDKLKACLPYLNQFDIISHAMMRVSEKGTDGIIEGRQLDEKHTTDDLLVFLNNIPLSSQVIRKSLLLKLNGFSESKQLIGVEDYDLLIRASILNSKFKHLHDIFGYYWEPLTGDNISATTRQMRNEYNVFFTHRKSLPIKKQRDAWCHLHLRHARRHYRNGRYQLANKDLCIAMRTHQIKFFAFAFILRIINSRLFPTKLSKIGYFRI